VARRVFYLFGHLNADGSPSIYDSADFPSYRFFLCDTPDDLPVSNIRNTDFAVVKSTNKFLFGDDQEFKEVQGTQGPQGIQGIEGPAGGDGGQGPQGIDGIQGIQGDQGIQGIQGIQGEEGPPGTTDHTQLTHLPYDESGHTGFSPSTHDHDSVYDPIGEAVSQRADHETDFSHALLHSNSLDHNGGTQDTAISGKEPGNANIQAHVTSQHAPSNAQKNSDILKSEIEAKLTGEISSHTHAGGAGGLGYSLPIKAASQSTTTDAQTLYWGGMLVAPSTTAARWRVYIPKTGTIKTAFIYSYAGTAGTG